MKKNVGNLDRGIRVLLGLLIIVAYNKALISGPVAIALGVVAAIFILTSLVSFCPLYVILGLSSNKK